MSANMCGCGMRPKSKEEKNVEMRKEAAKIVAGVENYSGADRARRAAEVKAAFPPVATAAKKTGAAKASAAKAAGMKAAAKGPKPAGMSTGPHDGDLC